jgi:hypothetical protein
MDSKFRGLMVCSDVVCVVCKGFVHKLLGVVFMAAVRIASCCVGYLDVPVVMTTGAGLGLLPL